MPREEQLKSTTKTPSSTKNRPEAPKSSSSNKKKESEPVIKTEQKDSESSQSNPKRTTNKFPSTQMSTSEGVVKRRQDGTVKWFDALKGYGFITPRDGSEDVFVHQTEIYSIGFRTLNDNEPVVYDVEIYEGTRVKAVNVTGPQNNPVLGGEDPRPKVRAKKLEEAQKVASEGQTLPGTVGIPPNGTPNYMGPHSSQYGAAFPALGKPNLGGAPVANILNPNAAVFNQSMTNPALQAVTAPGYGAFQAALGLAAGFQPYRVAGGGVSNIPTPEQYRAFYNHHMQQQMHIQAAAAAAAQAQVAAHVHIAPPSQQAPPGAPPPAVPALPPTNHSHLPQQAPQPDANSQNATFQAQHQAAAAAATAHATSQHVNVPGHAFSAAQHAAIAAAATTNQTFGVTYPYTGPPAGQLPQPSAFSY